jgi:hypothetical protein
MSSHPPWRAATGGNFYGKPRNAVLTLRGTF